MNILPRWMTTGTSENTTIDELQGSISRGARKFTVATIGITAAMSLIYLHNKVDEHGIEKFRQEHSFGKPQGDLETISNMVRSGKIVEGVEFPEWAGKLDRDEASSEGQRDYLHAIGIDNVAEFPDGLDSTDILAGMSSSTGGDLIETYLPTIIGQANQGKQFQLTKPRIGYGDEITRTHEQLVEACRSAGGKVGSVALAANTLPNNYPIPACLFSSPREQRLG